MQLSLLVTLCTYTYRTYAAEPTTLTSVDYFKRASLQLAQGNDQQALNDFRRSLAADPNFEPAKYNLANTYLRLGKIDPAFEAASSCQDPRCAEIVRKCEEFRALSNEQPNEDDCQLFNHLLTIAPKSTEVLTNRAQCYFANDKVLEALTDLRQVVQIDPSDSQAAAKAAVGGYILMDQQAASFQMLRRCVSYDDEATICKQANRQLRKLQKVVEQPPLKIKVAALVKETRKLLKEYSIDQDVHNDGALVDRIRKQRCNQLALRHKYDEAAKVCAQVRDADPDFAPAKLVQAHVDAKEGNLNEALRTLRELMQNAEEEQIRKLAHEMEAEIHAERQQQQQRQYNPAPDKDYYEILGVDEKADKREVRRAYRQLSKTYHPDKYRGKDLSAEQVMEKMQNINEAYEILTDDDKRADYDAQRSGGGQQFGGQQFGGQQFGGPQFGGFGGGGFGGFGGFPNFGNHRVVFQQA